MQTADYRLFKYTSSAKFFRLIPVKACTQVRQNITQVARNSAPVSLSIWLALNDGNGNTIQIKSLQTAAVCIVQEQTS